MVDKTQKLKCLFGFHKWEYGVVSSGLFKNIPARNCKICGMCTLFNGVLVSDDINDSFISHNAEF